MLNLHLLECTVKGYDHISDLLLAKYWVITGCKYSGCSSLANVYCYAFTPPVLAWETFPEYGDKATLHVPKGRVSAYKKSDWRLYFNNIVEMKWPSLLSFHLRTDSTQKTNSKQFESVNQKTNNYSDQGWQEASKTDKEATLRNVVPSPLYINIWSFIWPLHSHAPPIAG